MKRKIHLTLLAFSLLVLAAGTVQAQDISFDIQSGTNTQSGFTAVRSLS